MSRFEITVAEVAERMRSGQPPQLLDVRRYDEHENVRIEPSTHIPLDELTDRLDELDPKTEYVVYCHHGVRSLSGAAILEAAGFANPLSLSGGIDAWSLRVDSGLPRY